MNDNNQKISTITINSTNQNKYYVLLKYKNTY